jgi:hypothetical protein
MLASTLDRWYNCQPQKLELKQKYSRLAPSLPGFTLRFASNNLISMCMLLHELALVYVLSVCVPKSFFRSCFPKLKESHFSHQLI